MTGVTGRLDFAALRYCDAIFVENYWMQEWLKEHMDPARILFAPPGVDTDLFHPVAPRSPSNSYILSVGRFEDPRKNVELLFRAYYRLRQALPEAPKLLLAGLSGPTKAAWRVASSLGIVDYIEVREGISLDELVTLYQNASFFVLSSAEEGLGIVILEAMACGLPIVSTRCGGPEVSVIDGVNGYLTPLEDDKALALRMEALILNDELRESMGRKGRQLAEERFSLAVTSQTILGTYDHLLARKSEKIVV
jgi:glycosyltransferase involved in cell wall biosynthesis